MPPPAPAPLPSVPAEPAPRRFASSDIGVPLRLAKGVEVLLDGELVVTGPSRSPRVHLVGTAVFDVVPGSVDSFLVDSDAAQVQVLGTRFEVQEGIESTRISVERGRVEAICQTGERATLGTNDALVCHNAAGLMHKAMQARLNGESTERVLEYVEDGLKFPESNLRERLELMRDEALDELGRLEQPGEPDPVLP